MATSSPHDLTHGFAGQGKTGTLLPYLAILDQESDFGRKLDPISKPKQRVLVVSTSGICARMVDDLTKGLW